MTAIKYSATPVDDNIRVNNIVIGNPTTPGFWSDISPPPNGYVIYSFTNGYPTAVVAHSDDEAIYFAKSFGGININTIGDALTYLFTGSTNTAIVNTDYPTIVTNGLITHLDANLISSYPKRGSTWYSLVGTNNAIKAGSLSPSYPLHNSNGWFIFTGGTPGDNYSRFELNVPSLDEITVSAWHYSLWSDGHILRASNEAFQIGSDGYAVKAWNTKVSSYRSLPLNTWINDVLTFSGTTLTGYRDGVYVNSRSDITPGPIDSCTLMIGARNDLWTAHYVGYISMISIYNRALSLSEVLQNYYSIVTPTIAQTTNGLILYLDAGNKYSYGGGGTVWNDLSTNRNNGILAGSGHTFSNGSISFNGVDDTMTSTGVTISQNFTIDIWLLTRTITAPAGYQAIFTDSIGNGYGIWIYNGGYIGYYNSTEGDSTTDFSITVDEWVNVVITAENYLVKFYINTIKDSLEVYDEYTFNMIGCADTNYPFIGSLSSILVYDRTLSLSEIQQNYSASKYHGLVVYLDADNDQSYPGSGNVWYDLTKNNNNATILPGVSFNNKEFIFNGGGRNYRIDCGTNFSQYLSGNTDFSIECLVYCELPQTNLGDIWGNHYNFNGIVLQQNGTDNQYYWAYGDGSQWVFGNFGFTLESQQYSHVTIICKSALSGFTYVNGQLINTTKLVENSGLLPNPLLNFQLGIGFDIDSGRNFKGNISSFKIYNKALSSSEVMASYIGPIVTNGLILYLDAGNVNSYPTTGTIWYDLSGQGANCTMVGTPTWNSDGYFYFGGDGDGFDGVNVPQNYQDLIVGMWSETNGNLEMVFATYNDQDFSFRTINGKFKYASEINYADWNYEKRDYNLVDGQFRNTDVDLTDNWHIVRLVRTSGSSFVYSISSDFLSRYYKGKIAFILSYNRILSNDEVLQNYNALRIKLGL